MNSSSALAPALAPDLAPDRETGSETIHTNARQNP